MKNIISLALVLIFLASSAFAVGGTSGTGRGTSLVAGASGGGSPTGAAGGDLSGTYPNPSVVNINGVAALTSITTPLLIGGAAAGSTLTYKSTSGVGTTDAHIWQVGSNGATEAMRINTSGNVGIGTTTISNKLSVNGSVSIGSQSATASTNGLFVSGHVSFGTNNGTSTHPLDVVNTTAVGLLAAFGDPAALSQQTLLLQNTANEFNIVTRTAGDLAFGTGNTTDQMIIKSGGNVGIGTTSVPGKFAVSGNFAAGTYGGANITPPTNGFIISGNVGLGTSSTVSGAGTTIAAHIGYAPTDVPAVSTCGSGTLATGSTDNKGQITGITAATACTITFSSALPAAPACAFSSSTGVAVGGVPSTSAVTTVMAALTGSLAYLCQ